MVPTIRTVLGLPSLALRLRAGRARIDNPVRWVAVSELEDPTPYLEGGELLLTTGLRLDASNVAAYVEQLVAAGVSGVGVGVGLTHDAVPPQLLEVAEEAGLPVLEVPEPTPFMAITRAVSDLLAATEYEAVTRTVAAQRDLTRAALASDGAKQVVARLAALLTGTAVLVDPSGALLEVAPTEVPDLADWLSDLQPEVDRLRERGPRSAASFARGGATVVLQPLAPAGRIRGFLAVSRAELFSAADLALVNVAVALVSLILERSVGSGPARRELRSVIVALLADGVAPDQLPVDGVGWATVLGGPIRVLVANGSPNELAATLDAIDETDPKARNLAGVRHAERLVVLAGTEPTDDELNEFGRGLAWGISDEVPATAIADGLRQASRALATAAPGGVRRFTDLASGGLVGLVNEEAASGFAEGLLGPLEARDRGDLVASVRAWLAHNGQWDAAATSLGVHRHTLRYRMRRVEELLDRPLDDPDLRAELWVALAVRDRDAFEFG